MGSSYSGEPNLGNERSAGSSRKGKKSSGSEKANKQPQRGLGVAQLEKIRLQTEMGCTYLPSLHGFQEDMRLQAAYPSSVPSSSSYSHTSSSPSYPFRAHSGIMMGLGEAERANIRYGDSQPTGSARWNPSNGLLETQQFVAQPNVTRHFLNPKAEDSLQKKRRKDGSDSMGSSNQNSETSDSRELDLELRLSL